MACALKVRAEKRKRSAGVGVRRCEISGARGSLIGVVRVRGDASPDTDRAESERMNTKLRSSMKSSSSKVAGKASASASKERG